MIVTLHSDTAYDQLAKAYQAVGIEVHRLTTFWHEHRRLAAWTPLGHIAGQNTLREWYEARNCKPWVVSPEGYLDGADMFWPSRRKCILGLNNSSHPLGGTSELAARWIEKLFARYSETSIFILTGPSWWNGPLTGLVNFLHGWQVYVDEEALCGTTEFCSTQVVPFPSTDREKGGMGWVQHGKHVFISEDCRESANFLCRNCPEILIHFVPYESPLLLTGIIVP